VATMQETGGAAAHAKIHVPPVRPTTCLTSSSTARARRPSSRSVGPPMRWRCSARSTTCSIGSGWRFSREGTPWPCRC
jgi:hypothetical protein